MGKAFTVLIIMVWLLSPSAYAAEPDFFIDFSSCKNVVGYLVPSDESLKIIDGDPTTMGCARQSSDISCYFVFQSGQKGHKGNSEAYKVVLDSPPLLYLSTSNGSAFIAINTTQHAAVLVSRVLDKQYAGSKVCQGVYLTSFEMDKMDQ